MIRALALLAALMCGEVMAAPPTGVYIDPATSAWFRSLGGGMCCREADCRQTQVRQSVDGSGIEALISKEAFGEEAPDEWRKIPDNADLHRNDNPTGHAVVCFLNDKILCFVPAVGL